MAKKQKRGKVTRKEPCWGRGSSRKITPKTRNSGRKEDVILFRTVMGGGLST